MSDWQLIATAPKDGTAVDLWMEYYDEDGGIYCEERRTDCHYYDSVWHDGKTRLTGSFGCKIVVTHWRAIEGPGGRKHPTNHPADDVVAVF